MTPEQSSGQADEPSVAVIVPAYLVEDYVVDTLRSVQEQTVSDWECIVIDDGSPDGTAAKVAQLAATDSRIRLIRQANKGLSGARNSGLAHLSDSVRYVAFLDSDDLWCADALEQLLEQLDRDPAAVGSYGYAELMDEKGDPLTPGVHPARQRKRRRLVGSVVRPVGELEPLRFNELIVINPVWPPAVALHRREVVDQAGGFDPVLKQCEDLDFMIRMGRFGHYLPTGRQVAWYRQHAGQMTKRRAEFWWANDMLRLMTWEAASNTPEQRRDIARAWRVAQLREIAFCTFRIVTALRERRWPDVRRLLRGWALLTAQLLRLRPPVARIEHVRLAGRDV